MKRVALLMSVFFLVPTAMHFTTNGGAAAFSGEAGAGRQVHVANCQRCHGSQGKGDGPAGKLLKTKPADWTDKSKMSQLSDSYLFNIISNGGGGVGKSSLMPAFKDKLSEQQVRDVISFIRSL